VRRVRAKRRSYFLRREREVVFSEIKKAKTAQGSRKAIQSEVSSNAKNSNSRSPAGGEESDACSTGGARKVQSIPVTKAER
jgi:hypothetical protein